MDLSSATTSGTRSQREMASALALRVCAGCTAAPHCGPRDGWVVRAGCICLHELCSRDPAPTLGRDSVRHLLLAAGIPVAGGVVHAGHARTIRSPTGERGCGSCHRTARVLD